MATVPLALLLAALAVGLRLLATRRADADRLRLAEPTLLQRYVRLPATAVPYVRLGLLAVGIGALALASRAGGAETRRTDPQGSEIILVLDALNSMLAADVEPSRLQVQRDLAGRLATRTDGRIGVVYFAGRAYVLSPLTTDVSAVEMLVEGVRPAAVGLGGSSIAAGLTQAIDLLAGGEDEARKAIVLFSDGEETTGQPFDDALARARDAGIVVHAVGIGTEQGGQIPLTREASLDPSTAARRRGGTSVLQGPDGAPVVTRLAEAALSQVAAATGGRYVRAAEGIGSIERDLADGSSDPITSTGDAAVGLLLMLAFVSLWGKGSCFHVDEMKPKLRQLSGWAVGLASIGLLTASAGQGPQAQAPSAQEPAQEPRAESETLARYRAAAASSDRPIDYYNLGTALLYEGLPGDAQLPLQQSLGSEREAVRASGYYNFGLSAALDGRLDQNEPSARRQALEAAREAFRQVLRGRPADEDARWNLELVERWLEEEQESGGDGQEGGQGDSPQGSGAGAAPSGGSGELQMLSPEQAAALLDQAGDAEASIRDRVMGRNRFQDPVVEKNW